jgi:hypothetical protein
MHTTSPRDADKIPTDDDLQVMDTPSYASAAHLANTSNKSVTKVDAVTRPSVTNSSGEITGF